jgi:hypothetical protein
MRKKGAKGAPTAAAIKRSQVNNEKEIISITKT